MKDFLKLRELFVESYYSDNKLDLLVDNIYTKLESFLLTLNHLSETLCFIPDSQSYDDACWDLNSTYFGGEEYKEDNSLVEGKIKLIENYLKSESFANKLESELKLKQITTKKDKI